MTDPTPGEPFEAHGLTWEPSVFEDGSTLWVARSPANDGQDPFIELRDGEWFGNGFGIPTFDSAEAALACAIRTCPGARCGSCASLLWRRGAVRIRRGAMPRRQGLRALGRHGPALRGAL
jgi:hypothetical protein